jgi:hypothetical protein
MLNSYLLDHIHELGLSWILSEGSHDGSELLGGDGTCMMDIIDAKVRTRMAKINRDKNPEIVLRAEIDTHDGGKNKDLTNANTSFGSS